MPDLTALSLPVLALVFAAGAALVWYAGTKLARYADAIAERTGIGHATIGVLMLGAMTSLPEVTTTSVATLSGHPAMAVNNMLGGIAFQVVVIALADLFVGKSALTSMIPGPRVILNALVLVVLLTLVAVGVMVGDWAVLGGIGFFPLLIAATYILCMAQLSRQVAVSGWEPARTAETGNGTLERLSMSGRRLALLTAGVGVMILLGGTVTTLAAEAIAETTGTGTGVIGLTLLALATSLPELTTAIAAVRLHQAELAIGDILGSNMFNAVLILFVDVLDQGEPVLRQVDRSSTTAALLAILLTVLYLIGLVERRNKSFLRMGYDSIAVLVVYAAGMAAILTGITSQ